METPKTTAAAILRDAKRIPVRETLATHKETITTLREKNYTWREIAEFFRERGIETDHSKLFRFMQREGNLKMTTLNGLTFPSNFFIPSADKYFQALMKIPIQENQEKMLRHHYLAHNRTATATELSESAGYKPHQGGANRWYGELGEILGKELSMVFAIDEGNNEIKTSAIATVTPNKMSKEWEWVMHHELAKAIRQLERFKAWNTL